MTLKETGEIFFGFTLYFAGTYDFVSSNYKLPGWFQKQMIQYTRTHENTLLQYRQFGKRTVIVFALLNQLKYRMGYQINYEMDTGDTAWFFDLLSRYPVYFDEDIQFLIDNIADIFDIYTFHVQRKIRWFTMAYVLAMLDFNKTEILNNELIQQEMKYITKALKVFRFNTDLLHPSIIQLQKKIDLLS